MINLNLAGTSSVILRIPMFLVHAEKREGEVKVSASIHEQTLSRKCKHLFFFQKGDYK